MKLSRRAIRTQNYKKIALNISSLDMRDYISVNTWVRLRIAEYGKKKFIGHIQIHYLSMN